MNSMVLSGSEAAQHTVTQPWSLDGRHSLDVARPGSGDEAVQLVRDALRSRVPLVPWGGGCAIESGNLLKADGWIVASTEGMSGDIEFSPDDMVVTAGSGTTLAALQAVLADSRQFLPVDAPCPERANLGGIVACNAQGLLRPAFGTPRDRLLGLRAVTGYGDLVRAGGKVVKNVAGYDLCKLFAGSYGTLGLITEVTFKTNPLPEETRHLVYRAEDIRSAATAALAVLQDMLEPAYLVAVTTPVPSLCVGLLGGRSAVSWQAEQIHSKMVCAGLEQMDEPLAEDDLRHMFARGNMNLLARAAVLPGSTPLVSDRLSAAADVVVAHVTTGIVEIGHRLEAGESDVEVAARVAAIVRAVGDLGTLTWPRLPVAQKQTVDVWGPKPSGFALMKQMKHALDPYRLFSPGRFVGRL